MNRLKWLIALVALCVVPLGIGTAPASSATCGYHTSDPYWTGAAIEFQAQVQNCFGFDKVEFGLNALDAGFWDYSIGSDHPMNYGYSCCTGFPVATVSTTGGSVSATYGISPWCAHLTHYVYPYFEYRMHNATWPGTWGPWHQYTAADQWIVC